MVEKIIFPNSIELKAGFEVIDQNHIKIGSRNLPSVTDEICLDGPFGIYGVYVGYTTVYKLEENSTILSNDGSVYVEPEPMPIPDPYYEPSLDDRIADLEAAVCELAEIIG